MFKGHADLHDEGEEQLRELARHAKSEVKVHVPDEVACSSMLSASNVFA